MLIATNAAITYGFLHPSLLKPIQSIIVGYILFLYDTGTIAWVAYGSEGPLFLMFGGGVILCLFIGKIIRPIVRREDYD